VSVPSLEELLSELKTESSDLSFLTELAQKLNDVSATSPMQSHHQPSPPTTQITASTSYGSLEYLPSHPSDAESAHLSPTQPILSMKGGASTTASVLSGGHLEVSGTNKRGFAQTAAGKHQPALTEDSTGAAVGLQANLPQPAHASNRQQRVYDTLAQQRRQQEAAAAARWGSKKDAAPTAAAAAADDVEDRGDAETMLCTAAMKPTHKDLFVFVHVPKTGGSSFYDTLRWLTMKGADRPRWYPDKVGGSASFLDEGCGVAKTGSAHCDYSELEACLGEFGYLKHALPKSATILPGGTRKYVTVLRHPVKRVVSEYFFACTTKKRTRRSDKMINTPQGPKVLLDWSVPLWKSLDHKKCAEPSPEQFKRWVDHPDNPANGRYARFIIPRTRPTPPTSSSSSTSTSTRDGVGLLFREHNCLVGDHGGTVRHWNALLLHTNSSVAEAQQQTQARVRPLAELTSVMNGDKLLRAAAKRTLLTRFWFVGVLEKLDQTYGAFCDLGAFGMCGTKPPSNPAQEHRSSSRPSFVLDASARHMIEERNGLDLQLYDVASERLAEMSSAFRKSDREYAKGVGGGDVYRRNSKVK